MSKELFDAVVGTPPPSTVDAAAIVRRRRRVATVRRFGIAIVPIATAAVIAMATLPMIGGAAEAPPVGPSSRPHRKARHPSRSRSSCVTLWRRPSPTHVPDAHWLPDGQPPVVAPEPPPAPSRRSAHEAGGCQVRAPRCSVATRTWLGPTTSAGLAEHPLGGHDHHELRQRCR